ncbi:hypothetical protein ACOSQ3_013812 [Xanthoceras sorbifolium]
MEGLDEVSIHPSFPYHKVNIGSRLSQNIKTKLISFLTARHNSFAWSHANMTGIYSEVLMPRLQDDPDYSPIKQKRRKFEPECNKVINEEIQKLIDIGSVREVNYPDWLTNIVVVKKKNGKWRVCIDFTDLNKACPKDSFPLPYIDMMVEATAGHELLSLMDAFSGYNQILMHPEDQEKNFFHHGARHFLLQSDALWSQKRWGNLPKVSQQNRTNHRGLHRRHAGKIIGSRSAPRLPPTIVRHY